MKPYLQEFAKGVAKYLGGLAAAAALTWLASRLPIVRNWGNHFSTGQAQVLQWWLLRIGVGLLVLYAVLVHLRTRAKLRAAALISRFNEVAQIRVGGFNPMGARAAPSPEAFELLKMFYDMEPHRTITVAGIAARQGTSHEYALRLVQELHQGRFIRTAQHGPGEWNGQYIITGDGRECVEQLRT
jgi:hypothetical protein